MLDGELIFLKRQFHASPLLAGESYQASTTFEIPANASGDWEIIVRADANEQVLETGGEDNNDSVTLMTNVVLEAADLVASDGSLAINVLDPEPALNHRGLVSARRSRQWVLLRKLDQQQKQCWHRHSRPAGARALE